MPKLVPIGNAPLIGALAGASTAAGGIYAQQREREQQQQSEQERLNLSAFNSQLRMQEDDYRTGNDLSLKRAVIDDERRQQDAAKAERATGWGLYADKIKANADPEEHPYVDLAGKIFIDTGKVPTEILKHFSVTKTDEEKIKNAAAELERKRQADAAKDANTKAALEAKEKGQGAKFAAIKSAADAWLAAAVANGRSMDDPEVQQFYTSMLAGKGSAFEGAARSMTGTLTPGEQQSQRREKSLQENREWLRNRAITPEEKLDLDDAEDRYEAMDKKATRASQLAESGPDAERAQARQEATILRQRADMLLRNIENQREKIRVRLRGVANPSAATAAPAAAPAAVPTAVQPPPRPVQAPAVAPQPIAAAGPSVAPFGGVRSAVQGASYNDPRGIRDALAQQLGRLPTRDELAEALRRAGLGD